MIRRLFSAESKSITGAAILLGATSLLSRLLGLWRDRLLAQAFGAGDILDAYYTAFRIPDFVYNLLIVGALSAGFIPLFTTLLQKNKPDAWKFVNNVINSIGIITVGLGLAVISLAPALIHRLAPGFSPNKLALAVTLTRMIIVSPIILGLSSVVTGVLQAKKNFLIYSLAPLFYNTGIILGIIWGVPRFGPIGLGLGVIGGALLHLAIQLPSLWSYGWRYAPILDWSITGLHRLPQLMSLRLFSMATNEINFFVIIGLASTLGSGSVAVFQFANNLQTLPIGIIGISFAVAAFPTLAQLAARKETSAIATHLNQTTQKILFFTLPITILLLLLRAQVVRVTLGSGAFDWTATIATANTLAFFSFSLFAQCLTPLLLRGFFALQDTWTPCVIGIVTAGVNIIGSLWLRRRFGVSGLALAFSIASLIEFIWQWLALRHRLGPGIHDGLLPTLYKLSAASLFMAVTVQLLKSPLAGLVDMDRFWGILTQGIIAGGAGLVVYVGVAFALRTEPLSEIADSAHKKWLHLRQTPNEIIKEV
ncbi:MAG: murein biosynthesis integral membrane protein MurJ [Candidatus Magasanikbacteria bacterium]|nr:murein biosynthesis integral membrane protein MurJ [Candidatus Magasanikbacteria bacterium]